MQYMYAWALNTASAHSELNTMLSLQTVSSGKEKPDIPKEINSTNSSLTQTYTHKQTAQGRDKGKRKRERERRQTDRQTDREREHVYLSSCFP